MTRETCSACGHGGLEQFLDLGTSPIADAYTDTKEESFALERYPLQVAVCNKCWLVQLLEVLPTEMLFGTGYSFYTSASPPLSQYHADYAADVLALYPNLAHDGVLEIGCNDGDLLRHFALAGCHTVGVDPATGPVEVARQRSLDVRVRPFSKAFAEDLLELNGPFPLVIANHVLAHVADVSDMLAGISAVLAPHGVAMIEVQYLPDLLVNNAFDLVYHEHRNFFSLSSLEAAAARHDLNLADVTFTSRQGGSIRATFNKHPVRYSVGERLRATESWLQTSGPYEGFQGRVERIRDRLWVLMSDERRRNNLIGGYGAPAKATTLLNFCHLTDDDLEFIVDSTPAKQGRYVPGTGIRIIEPDRASMDLDTYLLLAWNYISEILHREEPHTNRWIVPIPAPVLI
jgi:SAM-dependent methyltransferase